MTVKKKVLLQPLERLDLEDLQGIQDIVQEQLARSLGGLFRQAFGLLKKWDNSTSINNSTHKIQFSDFSFFSSIRASGLTSEGVICKHVAGLSTNGECSFAESYSLTNAYYTSNSALPPAPTTQEYVSATHAQYYPYILCRRSVQAGDVANRRFWSVVDGAETVQAISTRQLESTVFHVGGTPSDYFDDGEVWCVIGRITKWIISGGSVALDLSCMTPYYLADMLIGNSTAVDNVGEWIAKDSPVGAGGLQEGMEFLRTKNDTLKAQLDALNTSFLEFVNKRKRSSYTVKHILDLRNPYTNTITSYSNTLDDFNLTIAQDFNAVETLGNITSPYTAQKSNASIDGVNAMLSTYAILVPAAYENMLFTCTINTLVPMLDLIDGVGAINFRTQDSKGFDILMNGQISKIATANKIGLIQYTDVSGATQSGFGFKLRRRDFLNTTYEQDAYNVSLFSIDITVG